MVSITKPCSLRVQWLLTLTRVIKWLWMLLINCINLNLNTNILCSNPWSGGDVETGSVVSSSSKGSLFVCCVSPLRSNRTNVQSATRVYVDNILEANTSHNMGNWELFLNDVQCTKLIVHCWLIVNSGSAHNLNSVLKRHLRSSVERLTLIENLSQQSVKSQLIFANIPLCAYQ